MSIARIAVGRPVGVTTLVLCILLFGAIALNHIGLDFLPGLESPLVAIVTVYPGADAVSIEGTVTAPLEEVLSTLSGLRRLRSTSMDNASLIVTEFEWNVDVADAIRQIESQLEIVHRFLPAEVQRPIVIETDPDQISLMLVAVSGLDDAAAITRAVEGTVKHRLEQIQGVAAVQILGGEYEEVQVRYDSDALIRHSLTPTLLQQILSTQNVMVPAGVVVDGDRRLSVRAGHTYPSLEALREQTVSLQQAERPSVGLLGLASAMPVRLRDVADVSVQPVPREGLTRVNQEPAVILQIHKRANANAVQVVSAVEDVLRELEADHRIGLSFHVLTTTADLIEVSLANLSSAGVVGGILAVLVLLFFLKEIGAILVIALAIPLSIVVALLALYAMGYTLNIMSLGGLALAVGMLVDNAIVVLENISRRRALGEPPFVAAVRGGEEVSQAVLASTLTTLVVFLPLLFLRSFVGMLFQETGVAVVVSLIASLFVALAVIPAASARLVRQRKASAPEAVASDASASGSLTSDSSASDSLPSDSSATDAASDPRASRAEEAWKGVSEHQLSRLSRGYFRALQAWTARKWLTGLAFPVLLLTAVWLPTTLETQLLPRTDGGVIYARYVLPPGSTIDQSGAFAEEMEAQILAIPEVKTLLTLVGDQGSADLLSRVQVIAPNEVRFTVVLHPRSDRSRAAAEVAAEIGQLPADPRIRASIEYDRTTAALGDDFFPGLTLEISGPDFEVIKGLAAEAVEALKADGRFHNVSNSVEFDTSEVVFRVTERSFQGVRSGGDPLTAGFVGLALRNHLTGTHATDVTIDGVTLPVVLRPHEAETESLDALRAFRVPGALLGLAQTAAPPILERIAVEELQERPTSIVRIDRVRTGLVQAELVGIGLRQAEEIAHELIEGLDLPAGYQARVAGLHRILDESMPEVFAVLLIAMALVYTVMAVQFESFGQPLVIMVTVPLAAVGALAALKVTGHSLSVPALIGMLLLIGISVNNGILLIDFVNQERRRGTPWRSAVLLGAAIRLRPILMTVLTTMLGLIPLALGYGEGSEMLAPLAVCVLGGLFTSTLLTLFIVPGILLLTDRTRAIERTSAPRPSSPALPPTV